MSALARAPLDLWLREKLRDGTKHRVILVYPDDVETLRMLAGDAWEPTGEYGVSGYLIGVYGFRIPVVAAATVADIAIIEVA